MHLTCRGLWNDGILLVPIILASVVVPGWGAETLFAPVFQVPCELSLAGLMYRKSLFRTFTLVLQYHVHPVHGPGSGTSSHQFS